MAKHTVHVTQHPVGQHPAGAVVSKDDFYADDDKLRDKHWQRLLDLGAIKAEEQDEDDDLLTLSEAQRSDSPPTLPNVPENVLTTQKEVDHVMSEADTFSGNRLPREGTRQQPEDVSTPASRAAERRR
jgi:hypothetical protein